MATAGAVLLGLAWPWALGALVLYAGGGLPHRRWAALSLLAAPLLLGANAELAAVTEPAALAWLVVAVAAPAPFFLRVGGHLPVKGAAVVWLGLPLLVAPVLLLDWAASFFHSDMATRAQVVLMAMAALLMLSGLDAWSKRRLGQA